MGNNSGQYLRRFYWLSYVIDGAELKRFEFIIYLGPSRHEDNGDLPTDFFAGFKLPTGLESVQVGHHDIEQDNIRWVLFDTKESLMTIRGDQYSKPLFL